MNGFSAADMSTAAANGFRDGLAAQPAAAQEAVVAYGPIVLPSLPYGQVMPPDDRTGLYPVAHDDDAMQEYAREAVEADREQLAAGVSHVKGAVLIDGAVTLIQKGEEMDWVYGHVDGRKATLLYAAPVSAAPVDARTLASAVEKALGWREGKRDAELDSLLEQAMAILNGTPAAPGIDLEQFREAVAHWKRDLHDDYKGGHIHDGGEAMRKADRLLRLIDDSQNGGKCCTCEGHGMIGGLLPAGGGYESEPCPDCSPKGGNDEANIPAPHRECYSEDGGDSWYEHPADAELVYGLKVGDTYTLIVSHCSVERTYRVTKAPDEASDDYEVEPVQATGAEVGA